MPNTIVNYDGSITMTPQQVVRPTTVEEIQEVLRDTARFPSPVRAMGSCHSLTPCVATDGTIIDMKGMKRVSEINEANKTFTAQAGLQFVEASDALRERDLQFMTNIEIGNMTLGSAATCHTKDALDGIEFGQVGTYVTHVKWVTPAGELAEASESSDPELLRKFRTSYGLAGVAYEVTFRVKPLEAIHLTYLPRPVDELTHSEVDDLLDNCEGLVCWTVGRTAVFQRRERIEEPRILASLFAAARRRLWNHTAAHSAHLIDQFISDDRLRTAAQDSSMNISELLTTRCTCSAASRFLHRKDHRLQQDAAVSTLCIFVLGISASRVARHISRLSRFRGRALPLDRISLQHASRLGLHPKGYSGAAARTPTMARSFRSIPFTRVPTMRSGITSCSGSTSSRSSATAFRC